MPPSVQPKAESASAYDGWFRALDVRGQGFYIDGAFPIRDYMVDATRWGLTRKSTRIFRQVSSSPSPSPSTSRGSSRTLAKRRKSARKTPYPAPKPRASKASQSSILISPEALDILKAPKTATPPEYACLQCGKPSKFIRCTTKCYHTLRKNCFDPARDKVEVRQTDPGPSGAAAMGLGVFVKPGQTIAKNDWLGEYLGELLPPSAAEADTSAYAFSLPASVEDGLAEVVIDAATHGNWTRFVNSGCKNNVDATAEQVGKVRIIALRARRNIRGGEQLLINYGRQYFEERGIKCCCGAKKEPHLPKG
jgi:hypothetical protein